MIKNCVICDLPAQFLYQRKEHSPIYYRCDDCCCVFEDEQYFLSAYKEKERYDTHNNDVEDVRYQRFVSPVVHQVRQHFDNEALGLDFGAGSGPVITKLLNDAGYHLDRYDPYYFPDKDLEHQYYDYIVCCETMEHFYQPMKEFRWMKELLKEGGIFFGKTKMIPDKIDAEYFDGFGYKNDPTHVVFYTERTMHRIRELLDLSEFYLSDGIIILKK